MTVEELYEYLKQIAGSTNASNAVLEYESEGFVFRILLTKKITKKQKKTSNYVYEKTDV